MQGGCELADETEFRSHIDIYLQGKYKVLNK